MMLFRLIRKIVGKVVRSDAFIPMTAISLIAIGAGVASWRYIPANTAQAKNPPAPPPQSMRVDSLHTGWYFDGKPDFIDVIRDEKRQTTCYMMYGSNPPYSPALSCLRDSK